MALMVSLFLEDVNLRFCGGNGSSPSGEERGEAPVFFRCLVVLCPLSSLVNEVIDHPFSDIYERTILSAGNQGFLAYPPEKVYSRDYCVGS